MKFSISAFSHSGTTRAINEDAVLVNGNKINKGELHINDENKCFCFVADGVGGNRAGEYAADFVLNRIKQITDYCHTDLDSFFAKINEELIKYSSENPKLYGTATTLSGIVIFDNLFKIIHAGDSQVWLLRDDIFFKVTQDHVLDDGVENSPITSYFGGNNDHLKIEYNAAVVEGQAEDLFLICTDGLLKSISKKRVKDVLQADDTVAMKIKTLMKNCLESGAEDNVSVIIIRMYYLDN